MYRAFSCDVRLSSKMAASIATEINIHFICKPLFYIIVRKHMMIAYAHGACDCSGYPVSLRNPTAMLKDSMMSVKTLYYGGGGGWGGGGGGGGGGGLPLTDE